MRHWLVTALVLLAGSATWAEEAKTDPAAIRARYAKQSAAVLGIIEPVTVAQVFYYKDGGTIGILLKDAQGKEFACSLDGRFLPTKEHPDERGTRNLFVNAVHPTRPGARMVDVRGAEESALYGVMLRWADRHPQRKALYDGSVPLPGAEFGNLWEIREFLLRLDRRFTESQPR